MSMVSDDTEESPVEYIYINLNDSEVEEEHTDIDKIDEADAKESISVAYVIKEIFTYIAICAFAALIAFAINVFVIYNAHVPTGSMVPTINVDDKLIGFRMAYLFSEPDRGDIIIFEHQCYNDEESEMLIKRLIGLPRDTVEIKSGELYINGELVQEDYLAEPMVGDYGPFVVPEDSYFFMGDNRNISDDARFWDNTFVSRDEIAAKAVIMYSPKIKLIE